MDIIEDFTEIVPNIVDGETIINNSLRTLGLDRLLDHKIEFYDSRSPKFLDCGGFYEISTDTIFINILNIKENEDYRKYCGTLALIKILAHEYGHKLHYNLSVFDHIKVNIKLIFQKSKYVTTKYSMTNYRERFAELFAIFCFPEFYSNFILTESQKRFMSKIIDTNK